MNSETIKVDLSKLKSQSYLYENSNEQQQKNAVKRPPCPTINNNNNSIFKNIFEKIVQTKIFTPSSRTQPTNKKGPKDKIFFNINNIDSLSSALSASNKVVKTYGKPPPVIKVSLHSLSSQKNGQQQLENGSGQASQLYLSQNNSNRKQHHKKQNSQSNRSNQNDSQDQEYKSALYNPSDCFSNNSSNYKSMLSADEKSYKYIEQKAKSINSLLNKLDLSIRELTKAVPEKHLLAKLDYFRRSIAKLKAAKNLLLEDNLQQSQNNETLNLSTIVSVQQDDLVGRPPATEQSSQLTLLIPEVNNTHFLQVPLQPNPYFPSSKTITSPKSFNNNSSSNLNNSCLSKQSTQRFKDLQELESSLNQIMTDYDIYQGFLKKEKVTIYKEKMDCLNYRRKLIKEQVFAFTKNAEYACSVAMEKITSNRRQYSDSKREERIEQIEEMKGESQKCKDRYLYFENLIENTSQKFILLTMNEISIDVLMRQTRDVYKIDQQLEEFNKKLQLIIEKFEKLQLFAFIENFDQTTVIKEYQNDEVYQGLFLRSNTFQALISQKYEIKQCHFINPRCKSCLLLSKLNTIKQNTNNQSKIRSVKQKQILDNDRNISQNTNLQNSQSLLKVRLTRITNKIRDVTIGLKEITLKVGSKEVILKQQYKQNPEDYIDEELFSIRELKNELSSIRTTFYHFNQQFKLFQQTFLRTIDNLLLQNDQIMQTINKHLQIIFDIDSQVSLLKNRMLKEDLMSRLKNFKSHLKVSSQIIFMETIIQKLATEYKEIQQTKSPTAQNEDFNNFCHLELISLKRALRQLSKFTIHQSSNLQDLLHELEQLNQSFLVLPLDKVLRIDAKLRDLSKNIDGIECSQLQTLEIRIEALIAQNLRLSDSSQIRDLRLELVQRRIAYDK